MGLYRIGKVGEFYNSAAVLADVFAQRAQMEMGERIAELGYFAPKLPYFSHRRGHVAAAEGECLIPILYLFICRLVVPVTSVYPMISGTKKAACKRLFLWVCAALT